MKSLLQRRSALAWLAVVAAGTAGPAHAGAYDDFLRAIARDDAATVASLLRRGFDPNARDPKGQPALILALREEARQVAEVLIAAKGLKVEERNAKDESALMMAALRGNLPAARGLIARRRWPSPCRRPRSSPSSSAISNICVSSGGWRRAAWR